MAGTALIILVLVSTASALQLRNATEEDPELSVANCGKAPSYPNAKPLSYADSRGMRYSGAFEANTFVAGDELEFKCDNGHTVDASAAGDTTFNVSCAQMGYFMPKGACLKASKCGSLPSIEFASPTGKEGVAPGSVEFACQVGYSLDGKKVIAGGLAKNRLFPVRCSPHGAWEQFEGECKPYAFMPSGKANAMYTKVFDTLFKVTCKSSMHTRFEEDKPLPDTATLCAQFDDAAVKQECETAVGGLKSDFESEKAARVAWNASNAQSWHNNSGAEGRPDIDDEAHSFCAKIWTMMGH